MRDKYWLVVVIVSVIALASGCQAPNPYHCPDGEYCPPMDGTPVVGPCASSGECRAPTSVCDEATMTCVECLESKDCGSAAPVCSDQHTCVQCQVDDNCDSKLCLEGGQCADLIDVIYVGGSGALDNPMCSVDMPCKTLAQGVQVVGTRKYIKLTGAMSDAAATTIHDKKVTIYGRSGAQLSRTTAGEVLIINGLMNPVVNVYDLEFVCNAAFGGRHCVEIVDAATATLTRVNVHNHGQAGIAMSGVKLVLTDSQVHDNLLEGLLITSGTVELNHSSIYKNNGVAGVSSMNAAMVTIDSSIITGNTGSSGGVSITGRFTIQNSIIAKNGSSGTTGGLFLNSTNGLVEFSTIANNVSDIGGNAGISCQGTVNVQNSILTANNSTVPISPVCVVTYSLTGTLPPTLPGAGNTTGEPAFLNMADQLNPGFFRIGASSAAINKAGASSPVDVDIDNQKRDDGMKDMGADEYK